MKTLYHILLMFSLIGTLFLISCQNGSQDVEDTTNKNTEDKQLSLQKDSAADTLPGHSNLFSPLTQQKVNDIRNAGSNFTDFEIFYYKAYNFDESGQPLEIQKVHFRSGDSFKVTTFNDISVFEGDLSHYDRSLPLMTEKTASFSKAEIETILNYLNANASYFFNHDEYNGQPEYLASFDLMCRGNYEFALEIGDPIYFDQSWHDPYFPAWAISKCVDEYPAPEHPLYGLFQILENDFIDEFE